MQKRVDLIHPKMTDHHNRRSSVFSNSVELGSGHANNGGSDSSFPNMNVQQKLASMSVSPRLQAGSASSLGIPEMFSLDDDSIGTLPPQPKTNQLQDIDINVGEMVSEGYQSKTGARIDSQLQSKETNINLDDLHVDDNIDKESTSSASNELVNTRHTQGE